MTVIQEPCCTASRADIYIVDKVKWDHLLAGDNVVVGDGHGSICNELCSLKYDDSVKIRRLPSTNN
eukprot:10877924-Heterocapsa_arctica.AAC.1